MPGQRYCDSKHTCEGSSRGTPDGSPSRGTEKGMRAGTNLPAVGTYNQAVILDAVRRAPGGISRVEVAERTGLSAQTATNVCRRLLEEGMIHETGSRISGVGKPRRILELRPNGRFAIGVHLDPAVVTVVLLNLAGAVVSHRSIATSPSAPVEDIIELIASTVESIIVDSGVDVNRLLGAGIAAPGPIDLAAGMVIYPPLLVSWGRVTIRDALASRLGMRVLLEKDVTAAAVAETWAGEPEGSFIFFYYGSGIGVGFALQNEVIRGVSGNAGEAGNIIVGGGNRTAVVENRWRLSESIMPVNVVARGRQHGVIPPEVGAADDAGIQKAFRMIGELAESGDAYALALVDEIAADIAEGLLAMIDLLDVDRVVFGGPFWRPLGDLLIERIPRLVLESEYFVLPHPVAFDEATVGENVAATGAACLVLDHSLSPRPTTLLISAVS